MYLIEYLMYLKLFEIRKLYVKPLQNGLADFNYFLLQKVNRFINKAINVF